MTNKYCLCLSTYVSAFGFVGFILFFFNSHSHSLVIWVVYVQVHTSTDNRSFLKCCCVRFLKDTQQTELKMPLKLGLIFHGHVKLSVCHLNQSQFQSILRCSRNHERTLSEMIRVAIGWWVWRKIVDGPSTESSVVPLMKHKLSQGHRPNEIYALLEIVGWCYLMQPS